MISLWWEILKNAKLSGKAKGKSFDASKIKINVDRNDCKRELKQIIEKAFTMALVYNTYGNINKKNIAFIDNELSDEAACEFVKTLKSKLPNLTYNESEGVGDNFVQIKIKHKHGAIIIVDGLEYLHLNVSFHSFPTSPTTKFFVMFETTYEKYNQWVKSI